MKHPAGLNPTWFIHSSACLSCKSRACFRQRIMCGGIDITAETPDQIDFELCIPVPPFPFNIQRQDKGLPFCKRYAPLHFLEWIRLYFDSISLYLSRIQSTINHHWFRGRFGTVQTTNIVCIIDILQCICVSRPRWVQFYPLSIESRPSCPVMGRPASDNFPLESMLEQFILSFIGWILGLQIICNHFPDYNLDPTFTAFCDMREERPDISRAFPTWLLIQESS